MIANEIKDTKISNLDEFITLPELAKELGIRYIVLAKHKDKLPKFPGTHKYHKGLSIEYIKNLAVNNTKL